LLVLFLLIWVVDSFFLRISTFLSDYISLYIRLIILGLILVTAVYLVRSGHTIVSHEQRPSGVVSTGAFRYVRHPLYLGSVLFYLGLTVSTASLFSLGLVVVIIIFYNHIASYEEKLLEDNIHCETHLFVRGLSPGDDLVKFAEDNQINEIIVGVRRRSKVGKLLIGSTAQYVILNASCPVVTIK
jgi:isoprenylcysteine carboxyl methyltransferase (ICMT) family protein YpbQ